MDRAAAAAKLAMQFRWTTLASLVHTQVQQETME